MMRELASGGEQPDGQEKADSQERADSQEKANGQELAAAYITVTPPSMRAMDAVSLAELLRSVTDRPVTAAASLEEGCAMALSAAGSEGAVCAMGSLYMVDELERLLG